MPWSASSAPGSASCRRRRPETFRPDRRYLLCSLPSALRGRHPCAVSHSPPACSSSRCWLAPSSAPKPPRPPTRPARVADFTLTDVIADKPVSLGDYKAKKAVVVVFIGTECPINNAYMPRLAELAKAYADKGVQFLAVNSNCNDTPAVIAGHAKKNDLPFPVLRDPANVVADQFGAKRTPEVFVLDAERRVVYHGRIDDQFGVGYKREAPTRRDLADALDEVLAGKSVSRPSTTPAGCFIARASRRRPTAASPSRKTFRACCNGTARSATVRARSVPCRS